MAKLDANHIKAFVRGTAALWEFVEGRVIPHLKANQDRTDYQRAMTGTYYRMQLLMKALVALPDPEHFQVTLSTARGLYELLLDLKLLQATPTDIAKYHDFPYVSRFSAAKKYADAVSTHPGVKLPTKHADYRPAFVTNADNLKKFDELREKHWGRNAKGKLHTPEHWSGKSMPDRALLIGPEEYLRCRSVYAQYCWSVHSGSVGTSGISREGLVAGFAWGLATAHGYFTEATELVCVDEKLFEKNEGLRHEFDIARTVMGRVYAQLQEGAE